MWQKYDRKKLTYRSRSILISELPSSLGPPDQDLVLRSLRKSGGERLPPHVAARSPSTVDVFINLLSNTMVSSDVSARSSSYRTLVLDSSREFSSISSLSMAWIFRSNAKFKHCQILSLILYRYKSLRTHLLRFDGCCRSPTAVNQMQNLMYSIPDRKQIELSAS